MVNVLFAYRLIPMIALKWIIVPLMKVKTDIEPGESPEPDKLNEGRTPIK